MIPNPFLATATAQPRKGFCVFAAQLQQGRLAYLWDHAAGGRPLLPATALFEAASAVGRSLHGEIAPKNVPCSEQFDSVVFTVLIWNLQKSWSRILVSKIKPMPSNSLAQCRVACRVFL